MPRSGIAGSYDDFLVLWGVSILFSIVAVPIYTPSKCRTVPLQNLLFVISVDDHSDQCEVIVV